MGLGQPKRQPYHPSQKILAVRITWADGNTIEAPTCEEAEAKIKEIQSLFYYFWDHQHFREVMAKQALLDSYGEIEIETDGDSRDFLQEMERGQFFNVAFILNESQRERRERRPFKPNIPSPQVEEVWSDEQAPSQEGATQAQGDPWAFL